MRKMILGTKNIKFFVILAIVFVSVFVAFSMPNTAQAAGGKIIVIDPGHNYNDYGNHDSGCVAPDGTEEADLNKQLAYKIAKQLQNGGYTVYTTWDLASDIPHIISGTKFSLADRANTSLSVRADLFISVHHNTTGGTTYNNASGLWVLYDSAQNRVTARPQSFNLAQILSSTIVNNLPYTKGNRASNINDQKASVLTYNLAPAVTIEAGFVTNKDELARLKDDANQTAMAQQVLAGVNSYFAKYPDKWNYDTTYPTAASIVAPVSQTYGNTFQVNAMGLSDENGVSSVRFAVWSKTDQSDLKWYDGIDFKNTNWGITVDTAKHNNNRGVYNIHVYATDVYGNSGFVGATTVNVLTDKTTPTATSIMPSIKQTYDDTFQVNALHVADNESGVKNVRFAVWSKPDQSDLLWYNGADFKNTNWGITVDTANHKNNKGLYNIHVYATNGFGKEGFIGSTTVNVLKDTQAPKATSIVPSVTQTYNPTFNVNAIGVSDDHSGVAKVRFAVWSKADQSDLKWYDGKDNNNGTWSITADIANHQQNKGIFNIHVYAADGQGNEGFAGSTTVNVLNDSTAPTATSVTSPVKQTLENTFPVNAMHVADNESGIKNVRFAVWSKADQSDLVWYNGVDFKNTNWGITVNTANHKNNRGLYNIHVYATNGQGVAGFVGATTVNAISDVNTPTAASVTNTYTSGKDVFTVKANGVTDDLSGVSKVQFAAWTKSDQSDLRWIDGTNDGSGNWSITENVSNHNNLNGKYNVHAYATDRFGNRGFVGATVINVNVDRTGPKASYIAANASTVESSFSVAAYGVSGTFDITGVQFAVWSKPDQSDIKWYNGTDYHNTNWGIAVNYSSFNYNKGIYNIHVYATDSLGIRKYLGATTVKVVGSTAPPTMSRIDVTPETIIDTFTANLINVQAGSGIAKVEVAVWSEINGQDDLKWYNASSFNNGNWWISVNYNNHLKNTGGYNIHVYVTDNNGNRIFVGAKTVQVIGNYGIMGTSSVTANQLVNYYISKVGLAAYPQYYIDRGMNLNKFAEMYMLEASYEGVNAEVAWAQMCNETNFLRFTGDVRLEQFNFAGLGATGGGVTGFDFAQKYSAFDPFYQIVFGIRGQIQHLKCYASTNPLVNLNVYSEPYDPRWWSGLRGTATTVEALAGRWAASTTYGTDLINIINGIKNSSTAYVPMNEVTLQAVAGDTAVVAPEPTATPAPTQSPAPAETPQPSPSVSPEPSASASPEPSVSASPEPSTSESPAASSTTTADTTKSLA